MDVSEFHDSVRAHDDGDDFEKFIAIVDTYVKNSSASEINIDHRTKTAILKFSERSAYKSLAKVRP